MVHWGIGENHLNEETPGENTMFGIGMPEMILIMAVALIVLGPKKLPDLAKSLGKALGEFRKASRELKDSINLDGELDDVKETLADIKYDFNATDISDSPEPADIYDKTADKQDKKPAEVKDGSPGNGSPVDSEIEENGPEGQEKAD